MILLIVIGGVLTIFGLYSLIRGKKPFTKRYDGVRNIALHSRIEGGATLLTGLVSIAQPFVNIEPAALVMSILVICIITFILEIVLKAI